MGGNFDIYQYGNYRSHHRHDSNFVRPHMRNHNIWSNNSTHSHHRYEGHHERSFDNGGHRRGPLGAIMGFFAGLMTGGMMSGANDLNSFGNLYDNPYDNLYSDPYSNTSNNLYDEGFLNNRQTRIGTAPQGVQSFYAPAEGVDNVLNSSASNTPTDIDLRDNDPNRAAVLYVGKDDWVQLSREQLENPNSQIVGKPNYVIGPEENVNIGRKRVSEVFNSRMPVQDETTPQGTKSMYIPDKGVNNVLRSGNGNNPTELDLTRNDPDRPVFAKLGPDDTVYTTQEQLRNPNFVIKGNPKIVILSDDNVEKFQRKFAQEQEQMKQFNQTR